MSLDQNLFTLTFTPNANDISVLDLVDSSGIVHYHRQRVSGQTYQMNVYDPLSESLLASATAASATSKHKTIELFNPTIVVELKYVGTLTFKWGFKWEDHEFEWKREECYIIRKPDPPVLVAVTKEPPGRIKTTTVQLLDYNINRFDIQDRKGLEIVMLTALLTFQDSSDEYHTPPAEGTPTVNPLNRMLGTRKASGSESAPAIPPKPAPRAGVDRVAELHAIRGDSVNEVTVEEEVVVGDWAQYCERLLQDEAMLFITIKSAAAEQVPKVLQVVEDTKRLRYKAGLEDEQNLHQYVVYDTQTRKVPKRINLNDIAPSKSMDGYTPPTSLTIHLSKIAMPELQPKAAQTASQSSPPPDKKAHRHAVKGEKEKEKAAKKAKGKERDKAQADMPASPSYPPEDPKKLKKGYPKPSPSTPQAHIPSGPAHPIPTSPPSSQVPHTMMHATPPPQLRPRPPGAPFGNRPQSTFSGPPGVVPSAPPRVRPLSFLGGTPVQGFTAPSFYASHVPQPGSGMAMPSPGGPAPNPLYGSRPPPGVLNNPPPPPPPTGGQGTTAGMVSGLIDRLSRLRS